MSVVDITKKALEEQKLAEWLEIPTSNVGCFFKLEYRILYTSEPEMFLPK